MTPGLRPRFAVIALFVLAVALCAAGIWRYGYGQALDQLDKQGKSDLALAADRFTGQLRRYQELAVLMAEHPKLIALRAGEPAADAHHLLLDAADKTGAMGLLYAAPDGRVLARAGDAPAHLRDSDYFARALQGALGQGYGLYGQGGQRAYVYAAPAFDADGTVRGVLVVLIDIADVGMGLDRRSATGFFHRYAGAGLCFEPVRVAVLADSARWRGVAPQRR